MEFFHADMQTMALYSELLEQLEIFEGRRSVATLKGNFAIKGGYVYLQYYTPGGTVKQLYIGKDVNRLANLTQDRRPTVTHLKKFTANGKLSAETG